MFVALWEYEVKLGDEERFEKAYGPDGEWVRLFRLDANYSETRLVREAFRAAVYLTMDFWRSREAYEAFMEEHQAEYRAIDESTEHLTNNERRIGWYELVAP